ncbi:FecR domain-containing protein [Parapedobacter indicus]|uniref:FecR family protein n=1 Tax=Parapedobacter indicus TaxID=1477437 RepID=A0A1I3K2H2_9SPHI|nr:FecR domain-containing protein [Parapedobacter indicus]PPL01684.1 FecR family protein [Parapedobacter indicus]SFI66395.1 FecR family protein [Parapedobacter indicus]
MNTEKFKRLIEKYQSGELTGEQRALLDQWFDSIGDTEPAHWPPDQLEALGSRIMDRLQNESLPTTTPPQRFRRWLPYVAAALLLSVLGTTYYYLSSPRKPLQSATAIVQDIEPGGNKATLTLPDGQTINLSTEQTGVIIGNEITYADGSSVLNTRNQTLDVSKPLSLSTPKGGTYQITLPDGTRVWLNSASTLRYPPRFDQSARIVELEGEAYFEVVSAAHKPRPFRVKTKEQTVEVLGTHFCITAYVDESETKTTLVEGAVNVFNLKTNRANQLKPGEQSIIRNAETEIRNVNTETVIAWKNGIFYFEETPFEQMMKQIDRWYDIDVHYQGAAPKELFSGKMSKNVNLQIFVDFLKDSGIHSRIKGRQLIVGE